MQIAIPTGQARIVPARTVLARTVRARRFVDGLGFSTTHLYHEARLVSAHFLTGYSSEADDEPRGIPHLDSKIIHLDELISPRGRRRLHSLSPTSVMREQPASGSVN